MGYILPSVWVDEAMFVLGATTGVFICENSKALKTEARVTIATQHFVALRFLRCLLVDVELGDGHLATGTLLRPCFLHPVHKATPPMPRRILLARHSPVIRLHTTSQARSLLTQRAQKLP
jgi:hypothetical protein